MILLPHLAVVFVGIAGPDGAKVTHQVEAAIADLHLERASVPGPKMKALVRHGDDSRDIVRAFGADGVIGGELVMSGRHRTLRLVIYDRDGGLETMSESPLAGRLLSKVELEVVKSNIEDEVQTLVASAPKKAPEPPKPAPPKVAVKAAVAPAPAPAPKKQAPPQAEVGFIEVDDAPPGLGAPPPRAEHHDAAPVATATANDAVSADEIEALAGGGGGDTPPPSTVASDLHLGASVGLGVLARSFSAPSTVAGYASSPVGALRLEAGVQPTARLALAVLYERTLTMTSPVFDGSASTAIQRWEINAGYAIVNGRFRLSPLIGLGRRTFTIDSTDPSRTPDSEYNYLVVGANASVQIGSKLRLLGAAAFEPVLWGAEPTEMAFGEATRWAFDVGAAVEFRPRTHVFVRAAADYQQFAWQWAMAGTRGGASAIDAYPSGTLSVGATY